MLIKSPSAARKELKRLIKEYGVSVYRLARLAQVGENSIRGFLSGRRSHFRNIVRPLSVFYKSRKLRFRSGYSAEKMFRLTSLFHAREVYIVLESEREPNGRP